MFAYEFTGRRYDVGNKLGYMQTSIEYGLEQDDIKEGLKEYLLSIEDEL